MPKTLGQRTLLATITAACIGGLGVAGHGSIANAAEPDAQPVEPGAEAETVSAADVRIKIVQADGVELVLTEAALVLGSDVALVGSHDGTEHRVSMRVDLKGTDKLRLKVGYARGGAEVIKAQSVNARAKHATEVSGPDVVLSVLVTPHKPRARIALPGGTDPLGGLFE